MVCGIYLIENKKTKQKYIGQSSDIKRRIREHKIAHDKNYIDNAFNKYGADMFSVKIIEELPNDKKILDEREQYWIKYYNTFEDKKHYNLTPGGDFCPSLIPAIAKKISKSNTGKKKTKEYKERLSQKMKGIHKGKNNPFYEKKHTKESIRKISEASKNREHKPHTDKTKKILSKKQTEYQEKNKKYFLWNIHCCSYDKNSMYRNKRKPNPCACFSFQYNGKTILGKRFVDFYTPELLYHLTNVFNE